jgi:hypothetical protein
MFFSKRKVSKSKLTDFLMVEVTGLDSSLRAEQLTLKRSLLLAKNVPLAHFLYAHSLLRFKSL